MRTVIVGPRNGIQKQRGTSRSMRGTTDSSCRKQDVISIQDWTDHNDLNKKMGACPMVSVYQFLILEISTPNTIE